MTSAPATEVLGGAGVANWRARYSSTRRHNEPRSVLMLLLRQFAGCDPVKVDGAQHAFLPDRPAQLNVRMRTGPARQRVPTLQAIGQRSFRQGFAAVPQDRMIGLDGAFHVFTPIFVNKYLTVFCGGLPEGRQGPAQILSVDVLSSFKKLTGRVNQVG